MPQKLQHSIILKYTSIFLALLLLNCSIDSPDFYSSHIPENLNINDQESIIELVIEKGLGYDNAIPEYDDTDTDEAASGKTTLSLDSFIISDVTISFKRYCCYTYKEPDGYYINRPVTNYPEIHSPPPEA